MLTELGGIAANAEALLEAAAPGVDLQSAQTLGELAQELTAAGIAVQVVEARASVRERLRHEGVDDKLGGVNRLSSVADAVDAHQQSAAG